MLTGRNLFPLDEQASRVLQSGMSEQRWDESAHPRDEKGKFGAGAGPTATQDLKRGDMIRVNGAHYHVATDPRPSPYVSQPGHTFHADRVSTATGATLGSSNFRGTQGILWDKTGHVSPGKSGLIRDGSFKDRLAHINSLPGKKV